MDDRREEKREEWGEAGGKLGLGAGEMEETCVWMAQKWECRGSR